MAKVTNAFASYDKGKIAFVGGVLVLVVLAVAGFFYFRNTERSKYSAFLPVPTPVFSDPRNSTFNVPADLPRAELKDVSGGDSFGVATKDNENGKYIFTVIADLPEPAKGYYYEVSVVNQANKNNIFSGKMYLGKGGWIANFELKTDYVGPYGINVSLNPPFGSDAPSKLILQGTFYEISI